MFIEHVLGVAVTKTGTKRQTGLFGNTSAYYGTVEQQGRLTLHLHMLLWIKNSLTPQEIRDKIMDTNSDFQRKIVEYLENAHVGEFMTGSHQLVQQVINKTMINDEYQDPTQTLPVSPPESCKRRTSCVSHCIRCISIKNWRSKFKYTVDDILLRSNIHTCRGGIRELKLKIAKSRGKSKSHQQKYTPYTGCKSNKYGKCKARFPRKIFKQTMVNPNTGSLDIRKGEQWMNNVSPVLTYLFRCNTDVTSLLSGTAIKAVIAYISDYITKPSLKTYVVFDTIRSVFHKNSEFLGGTTDRKEKARRLFTQIVNSLTAKMEIGAPMAAMYLLKNPDHYTDHKFCPFYWKTYVHEVHKPWMMEVDNEQYDKVILNKTRGRIVGLSPVFDYIYRPSYYEDWSLYDWIRRYSKKQKAKNINNSNNSDPNQNTCDSDGSYVESDTDITEDDRDEFYDDISSNDDTETELDSEDIETDQNLKYTSEGLPFLPGHPLHDTHQIFCLEESEGFVPNFIGGFLPRSDCGDREYYCSTMLTLFKPWRNGKDLRTDEQSWDDGFINHKFSPRQIELMKYFNLKHECLDAKDDYAAQLKKGEGEGIFSAFDGEFENDNDDFDYSQTHIDGDDFEFEDDKIMIGREIGKVTSSTINLRNEMHNVLKTSGWFDESPDGPPEYEELKAIQPEISRTDKEWQNEVKDKREQLLQNKQNNITSENVHPSTNSKPVYDEVKIVDKSYLQQNYKINSVADRRIIDDTMNTFLLNEEQQRAFKIIANHATMNNGEQLKLYIGGMGGTGKSQIIKALISFFEKRKESHRMIIVAPTGSAASLLAGSTYHSVLGINDNFSTARSVSQVRARLDGVDYVFLDEVSMLSCHDMYKISAQMAKASNQYNTPFGGKNVILAGDFAQLPPVAGKEASSLYSGHIGTQINSHLQAYQQESAIGKALWHKFTTVIILRKNMRQTNQSEDDVKLRTALENMRYKSCTPEDITFLRTQIAGQNKKRPKLSEKRFRNVSIITALNAQKDLINELGCDRFSKDTGQQLSYFYSYDKWAEYEYPDESKKRKRKKKKLKFTSKSTNITEEDQHMLWQLPHSATDHNPGKLALCIGMPVMIRHNDATELYITKGQEGTVLGFATGTGIPAVFGPRVVRVRVRCGKF